MAVCNGGNTFAAVLTNLSTSIETSRPDSRAAVTLCFNDIVDKWGEGGMVKGRQAARSYQKWAQYIVKLPKRESPSRQMRMAMQPIIVESRKPPLRQMRINLYMGHPCSPINQGFHGRALNSTGYIKTTYRAFRRQILGLIVICNFPTFIIKSCNRKDERATDCP